ncbi:spermidine synthase [Saliphagus infecundisoli]|uniref:Polyamine aminopropyltransferase n=1 Tax=Saliphagus infecundisoli TaxID=1849069 RepID=A0ABD5QFB2_9EURY|nr:fused MFS/spermidine synthase [Saliphagus infecundisoli]
MSGVSERVPRVTRPELAVFVSGTVSMGLEILAGRIVAPQFGSSIYTWGSIIGVSLAALSLGYHQGGKRAAHTTLRELTWLFLATAGYVAFLVFAHEALLTTTAAIPLPSRYASLPAITILFGPPTYLLGFVSPYGAQLSGKTGTGEASGHVYALGTIGSLVGTFGTTFLLIPRLSIDRIGLILGLLLVVTAIAIEAPQIPRRPAISAAVVTICLVGAVAGGPLGYSVQGQVVYETQTPYQELEVVDSGDTRTLYLDGKRHSAMNKDEPTRHVFDYTRYFHMPYLMADDPDDIDRVLFVGGGGFTGPKAFLENDDDVTVDVVEIDPEVIDAADTYFEVDTDDERLNVYNDGGRTFLQETDREYDAIVLDAYRIDKVPFELTTREFMSVVHDRLSADGVLVANVISAPAGPASEFYRSQYRTIDEVFAQTYAFRTADANVVQNVEVVATKSDDRLSEAELAERNDDRDIGLNMGGEIDGYLEKPRTDDVPVLRDDRATVDDLLDPMIGQRYVVEETNATGETDGSEENTGNGSGGVESIAPGPAAGASAPPPLAPGT